MRNLPIPNILNRYEEIKLFKYASIINNFILENKQNKQLFICLSAPQNGGKTALLNMINNFMKKNIENNIIINFSSWDYFNSEILWISIMYKIFKHIRLRIGWFTFYVIKIIYQLRWCRIIILLIIQTILVFLLHLCGVEMTMSIGIFIITLTACFMYTLFSIFISYYMLFVFKKFNYKLNFNTLNRLIEYDLKFFLSPLLDQYKYKLVLLIDDLDKFDEDLQNDFLLFVDLIKDQTNLPIIILFSFDIEIMSISSAKFIRKDILSYIDNVMDICIHIPKIPFKINIEKLGSNDSLIRNICSYNYLNTKFINISSSIICNHFEILNLIKEKYASIILPFQNYDFLNYEILCNYTYICQLYFNLHTNNQLNNIILDEKEKYVFYNLYTLSSTNNAKNKKIILLYNLSKFLIKNEKDIVKEHILLLTYLFEIFPCRMNLIYFMLYSHQDLDLNENIVQIIENLILARFPYREMIELNKRDLNIDLFKYYVKNIPFNRIDFFQLLPYILNINYSLKNKIESFL